MQQPSNSAEELTSILEPLGKYLSPQSLVFDQAKYPLLTKEIEGQLFARINQTYKEHHGVGLVVQAHATQDEQHRRNLRSRLRCENWTKQRGGCSFSFQVCWDKKKEYWWFKNDPGGRDGRSSKEHYTHTCRRLVPPTKPQEVGEPKNQKITAKTPPSAEAGVTTPTPDTVVVAKSPQSSQGSQEGSVSRPSTDEKETTSTSTTSVATSLEEVEEWEPSVVVASLSEKMLPSDDPATVLNQENMPEPKPAAEAQKADDQVISLSLARALLSKDIAWPVLIPNQNDVLCGEDGDLKYDHPGNVTFHRVVDTYRAEYMWPQTQPHETVLIPSHIVQIIRDMDPSGRFLERDGDAWYEISEERARAKVDLALWEVPCTSMRSAPTENANKVSISTGDEGVASRSVQNHDMAAVSGSDSDDGRNFYIPKGLQDLEKGGESKSSLISGLSTSKPSIMSGMSNLSLNSGLSGMSLTSGFSKPSFQSGMSGIITFASGASRPSLFSGMSGVTLTPGPSRPSLEAETSGLSALTGPSRSTFGRTNSGALDCPEKPTPADTTSKSTVPSDAEKL